MNESKYTILLWTYNEEQRVEPYLKALHGYANLVVIDNYSTDRTVDIARKYADRVLLNKNPGWGSSQTYQFGFDASPTDYVLNALVGRYYPPDLLRLFSRIASNGKYKAVAHYVQMYGYGGPYNTHGRPFRNRTGAFQFFNKRCVDLSKNMIHHELPFTGEFSEIYFPPKRREYCVLTLRDDDCNDTELKYARYSSQDARMRYARGERTNSIKFVLACMNTALRCLFWRGSIWQGMPGIITTWWGLTYTVNMHIKLWEIQKHRTRDETRAINLRKIESLIESDSKSGVERRDN